MNIIFRISRICIALLYTSNIRYLNCEEYCYSDRCDKPNVRYLFYDVNPSEGFNLRRDVYMRFALLARKLSKSTDSNLNVFKLVLPPWSHLIHWHRSERPEHIPWSLYFDLDSLKLFAPVVEMHQFLSLVKHRYGKVTIDEVYILQHFDDMFATGKFVEKMKLEDCQKYPMFFYYDNMTSDNIRCLSFHGSAVNLINLLKYSKARSVLIDHGEVALHHRFGDKEYWMARRSMRFSTALINIASLFRQKYLNSSDESDNTVLPEKWTDEKPSRNAVGGPYLAVHIRRKDFARSRPGNVPTLENVAKQVQELLQKLNLKTIFVATDATDEEYAYLDSLVIGKLYRYIPEEHVKQKFKDGGVAIIDQIICSHARYFIATQESTFSMRIQEEREIMGFPVESTFNSLCSSIGNCDQPSIWKVVY